MSQYEENQPSYLDCQKSWCHWCTCPGLPCYPHTFLDSWYYSFKDFFCQCPRSTQKYSEACFQLRDWLLHRFLQPENFAPLIEQTYWDPEITTSMVWWPRKSTICHWSSPPLKYRKTKDFRQPSRGTASGSTWRLSPKGELGEVAGVPRRQVSSPIDFRQVVHWSFLKIHWHEPGGRSI